MEKVKYDVLCYFPTLWHLMTGTKMKDLSYTLVDWFECVKKTVLASPLEAPGSITEDDNDCSFFTGIISQEQQQQQQLYDDASIVNEASSINEHTIADDWGQPCHRWGICNFNLQQDGCFKQLLSAQLRMMPGHTTTIKINEETIQVSGTGTIHLTLRGFDLCHKLNVHCTVNIKPP